MSAKEMCLTSARGKRPIGLRVHFLGLRQLVERQLVVVNWSQRQLVVTTIGRCDNWSHIEE